ncbi:hypothetical protein [Neorhizobium sp. JUb45]|uniref:hypothetical protein n=1 Tax=Neorhizobium sp. JUb45 TaxID=2485113 RepID=UPI001052D254|nr:hypothetical protein [Neorhizobium sp. JUb45]
MKQNGSGWRMFAASSSVQGLAHRNNCASHPGGRVISDVLLSNPKDHRIPPRGRALHNSRIQGPRVRQGVDPHKHHSVLISSNPILPYRQSRSDIVIVAENGSGGTGNFHPELDLTHFCRSGMTGLRRSTTPAEDRVSLVHTLVVDEIQARDPAFLWCRR